RRRTRNEGASSRTLARSLGHRHRRARPANRQAQAPLAQLRGNEAAGADRMRAAGLRTQHGGSIEPSRINVGQFLDRFERDWLATHVTARSAERYAYALKHVRRHLGDRSLQKLQPADLAALYAELFRGGLASPTIKLIHRVLHRALGQAK